MSINSNYDSILSNKSFSEQTTVIDSENRIKYNSSIWYSIFHRKEKQELNKQMWDTVSGYFQTRYHIDDLAHFLRIWKEIGDKEWKINSTLTVDKLHAIDRTFRKHLMYHGFGIKPLPNNPKHVNPAIQQIVRALLHGGSLSINLVQRRLIRSVLVQHDTELLKQFRAELQLELDQLAANPPKNAQKELIWRQFLGNILALIPYSYPHEGEIFNIPCLDANNNCRQVNYRTQVIELTPNHSPILITPISALGFLPVNDQQAPPVLSFLGTTYPAGNGFIATVLADFTPNMSVGEHVYKESKGIIDNWFKNNKNAHVVGLSLGGAMAFHTLSDHHADISRADIYNPPGLYEHCWKGKSFDTGCPINIYRQPGDVVSQMGFWPTGDQVKIYNIIPHQQGITEGMPRAHIQAFSGCEKVTFLKSDPKVENKSFFRKFLVFLHLYIGPFLFYYPIKLILSCYRVASAAQRAFKGLFKH